MPLGCAVEGRVRVVTLILGWKTPTPIALMRMLGHCTGVRCWGLFKTGQASASPDVCGKRRCTVTQSVTLK